MRIDYQNVDITQEERIILKEINFRAEAGEFVYLIGKVGTGKSSLLKTFYGELEVHTGNARVLDQEMTKIRRRRIQALRREIGIIFQDFQLLNDRNVRANLDFVLKATGWKKKEERIARINEVLDQVNMKEKADMMPYQLSGGEQQCVCIARAILNRPDIILADEATGNLDRENSRRTASLLYNISQQGTTVILATHNEELIAEFPGIVYRCDNGLLQECTEAYGTVLTPNDIESRSIEED
ncbi:MAG: ATP-binding cassette domain-containing protein [Paraprevotella sp.]|nr:ATP-binding cassette domain-containing protein [Paraprevotella sp.]